MMPTAFEWSEAEEEQFGDGAGYFADCCGKRIELGQYIVEGNDWGYRHVNTEDCNRGE